MDPIKQSLHLWDFNPTEWLICEEMYSFNCILLQVTVPLLEQSFFTLESVFMPALGIVNFRSMQIYFRFD